MKFAKILGILTMIAGLTGCGHWPPWEEPRDVPKANEGITEEQRQILISISASTRAWAKTCHGGITCFDDTDGDSALFAGIACLSGEAGQCMAVRASQGPDGKLWRSPARVGKDTHNSSSRDMLLGGLAYIIATGDQVFATKLVNYIHANNNTLCQDANDTRCIVQLPMHSVIWGTMRRIWEAIGLTPDATMVAGSFAETTLLQLQSQFSPAGYQTHLPMVEMLLRQKLHSWTANLADAAKSVASRNPKNPFYEYVAYGATKRAADLTIEACGGPEPEIKHYWTWQESDPSRSARRNGWDCIAMINFLLK